MELTIGGVIVFAALGLYCWWVTRPKKSPLSDANWF
jgi:hypothetical protein